MTFFIHNHRPGDDHDEEHDMTAEFIAVMSISLAATYLSASGDVSRMAIPGAMLAALVALLKAAHEKRSWQEKAANSIGISVVGSTGPVALVQYFWPDILQKFTWQIVSLLGFLGGLIGWSIAFAFVKAVGLRSDRFANRTLGRWERRVTDDPESKDGRGGRS